jgi:2-methylcitrate dehydratase
MFPAGHARNTTADLRGILDAKFSLLGKLAMDKPRKVIRDLLAVGEMGRKDLARIHDFSIEDRGAFE